ncbi:hypothetical protein OZN62_07310 [Aurantiacibacter sp. MUD11]|uniref:hypothetical protein n=1 Tax=Aurantiacibacter sp. MUD11 TaxID=3003265 RepID=UPI0022AABD2E|nr:hypothetical protein [Aurantiacibacter sp. MUD11]WAT16754.1 hypothetical protein OZN62_07310 [Aurantiacibacter sp. MUD11]
MTVPDPSVERFRFYCEDAHKAGEQAAGYGQSVMQSLFLANGAAIISLLTYLGNTEAEFDASGLRIAFALYSLGLFGALLANFLLFKLLNTNRMYSFYSAMAVIGEPDGKNAGKYDRESDRYRRFASAAAILSLIFFIIGSFNALNGIA